MHLAFNKSTSLRPLSLFCTKQPLAMKFPRLSIFSNNILTCVTQLLRRNEIIEEEKKRKKVNNTSFEKCLTSEYCLTFYHVTFLTFSSAAISQSSPLPLGATKFFFLATKIK